ncbi:MAG: hypothetical protein RR319_01335 [Bacteroides sp.]
MINDHYDIEKIESELEKTVISSGATKNVFIGYRPKVVDDKMNDFIVVMVVTKLEDLYAYGKCVCRIEMYAKNMKDGTKNRTKVGFIMGKLRMTFPIESSFCIFDNPTIIPMGNDDYGFNVTAINIDTIITI